MTTDLQEYTISLANLDVGPLLAEWKWLLRDPWRPLTMTSFGDWFLEGTQGDVCFLDLVSGRFSRVAASVADWEAQLQDRSRVQEWFMPSLVARLRAQGCRLEPGQCYGYKLPPVLNGRLAPDNIEPTDHLVHQSLLSQIHLGVKALPEGTRIGSFSSE